MADEKEAAESQFVKPEALGEVQQGVSKRVSETVNDVGKIVAAIAGIGIFFVATGYFVEWQKMTRGGLPPEQVLPLIPREQIAAAGVRELAISILLGGAILALLVFGLVALAKATEGGKSRPAKRVNRLLKNEVGVPTVLIGIFVLLIVPLDGGGLLVAVAVTGLLYYGLTLFHRFLADKGKTTFPVWRLVLATAVAAAILSGVRQHEFPEPRPMAIVVPREGEMFKATYVASTSDEMLFRLRRRGRPTELIVLHSDDLKSVRLIKSIYVFPFEQSLLDRIVDPVFADFRLSCIPPECRWQEGTRIGPSSLF
ncbi:MAG TPA: hypothetical protein VN752_12955 [Solirubrobacterales bacterium]|nr:hypothetical protein [Solirubrobacterales bacterium]